LLLINTEIISLKMKRLYDILLEYQINVP